MSKHGCSRNLLQMTVRPAHAVRKGWLILILPAGLREAHYFPGSSGAVQAAAMCLLHHVHSQSMDCVI